MAKQKFNVKPASSALEISTFPGKNKQVKYIVMKLNTEFHVFVEVEAKQAAKDCGCPFPVSKTTQQMWSQLWKERNGA